MPPALQPDDGASGTAAALLKTHNLRLVIVLQSHTAAAPALPLPPALQADEGAPPRTAAALRATFNRMGFNDREIVALSGAHALGRCHADASG